MSRSVCRPLTEDEALDQREARVPILCDCGQGDPPEHVICSACGDDWDECECGAADGSDVPWMLVECGVRR